MEIRSATPEDGPGIGRVHSTSWRTAYPQILPATYLAKLEPAGLGRRWRQRIERRSVGTVWVATDAGDVVGFVSAHRSPHPAFPAHRGEIGWLYVRPESSGRGIGSALLDHAIRALGAAGLRWVTVDVLEENAPARRFYERRRFLLGADRWRDPRLGARVVRYEQPIERVFDFRALAAREPQVR